MKFLGKKLMWAGIASSLCVAVAVGVIILNNSANTSNNSNTNFKMATSQDAGPVIANEQNSLCSSDFILRNDEVGKTGGVTSSAINDEFSSVPANNNIVSNYPSYINNCLSAMLENSKDTKAVYTSGNPNNKIYALWNENDKKLTFSASSTAINADKVYQIQDNYVGVPEYWQDAVNEKMVSIEILPDVANFAPLTVCGYFGSFVQSNQQDQCSNLKEIKGLQYLNMSSCKNTMFMFLGTGNLEDGSIAGDVVSWDLSKVENAYGMFTQSNLDNSCIDSILARFTCSLTCDSQLTNASFMFTDCKNLTSVSSTINMKQVQNLSAMFALSNISSYNNNVVVENSDTSNGPSSVKYLDSMFFGCDGLQSANVECLLNNGCQTDSSATSLFEDCGNLEEVNVTNWDMSNMNNISYMYSGCSTLSNVNSGEGQDWTSLTGDKSTNMFEGCTTLFPEGVPEKPDAKYASTNSEQKGKFDKSVTVKAVFSTQTKTLTFYFDRVDHSSEGIVYNSKDIPMSASKARDWGFDSIRDQVLKVVIDSSMANYGELKSTAYMCYGMVNANGIDGFEYLDVSSVTTMAHMFENYGSEAQITAVPNVSNWGNYTGNIIDMSNMFAGYGSGTPGQASALCAVPDVSTWDVSKVEDLTSMFENYARYSANISVVPNVSNFQVAHMLQNTDKMFKCYAQYSTQQNAVPDVSSWDTKSLKNMEGMFAYYNSGSAGSNSAITQVPDVSGWKTIYVENMNSVFEGYGQYSPNLVATPDVSHWNTSKVQFMNNTFHSYAASSTALTRLNLESFETASQLKGVDGMLEDMPLHIFTVGDKWSKSPNDVDLRNTTWYDISTWEVALVNRDAPMPAGTYVDWPGSVLTWNDVNIGNVSFEYQGITVDDIKSGSPVPAGATVFVTPTDTTKDCTLVFTESGKNPVLIPIQKGTSGSFEMPANSVSLSIIAASHKIAWDEEGEIGEVSYVDYKGDDIPVVNGETDVPEGSEITITPKDQTQDYIVVYTDEDGQKHEVPGEAGESVVMDMPTSDITIDVIYTHTITWDEDSHIGSVTYINSEGITVIVVSGATQVPEGTELTIMPDDNTQPYVFVYTDGATTHEISGQAGESTTLIMSTDDINIQVDYTHTITWGADSNIGSVSYVNAEGQTITVISGQTQVPEGAELTITPDDLTKVYEFTYTVDGQDTTIRKEAGETVVVPMPTGDTTIKIEYNPGLFTISGKMSDESPANSGEFVLRNAEGTVIDELKVPKNSTYEIEGSLITFKDPSGTILGTLNAQGKGEYEFYAYSGTLPASPIVANAQFTADFGEQKYVTITIEEGETDATFEAKNSYQENNPNLEYRIKRHNETTFTKWMTFISGEEWKVSSLNGGDVIEFKGNNPNGFSKFDDVYYRHACTSLVVDKAFHVSGSVMSLVYGDEISEIIPAESSGCFFCLFLGNSRTLKSVTSNFLPATTLADYCYIQIFEDCEELVQSPLLPAKSLSKGCYNQMFGECYNLSESPVLPAVTLAEDCYASMFSQCYSLMQAPELPVMSLEKGCYQSMFASCRNLTEAPVLPAITLAESCYWCMFADCTGLTQAPELPATNLAKSCYRGMFSMMSPDSCLTQAPELPATVMAENCYDSMFGGCTSLTQAPELPALSLAKDCYLCMFDWCTGLTQAPVLPATTLAEGCYSCMFHGCTNLLQAPVLPATTMAQQCYGQMFSYCEKLTKIPELPAMALAEKCYYRMFDFCSGLVETPVLPATNLADSCYNEMFYGSKNFHSLKLYAKSLDTDSMKGMFWETGGGIVYCGKGMGSIIQPLLTDGWVVEEQGTISWDSTCNIGQVMYSDDLGSLLNVTSGETLVPNTCTVTVTPSDLTKNYQFTYTVAGQSYSSFIEAGQSATFVMPADDVAINVSYDVGPYTITGKMSDESPADSGEFVLKNASGQVITELIVPMGTTYEIEGSLITFKDSSGPILGTLNAQGKGEYEFYTYSGTLPASPIVADAQFQADFGEQKYVTITIEEGQTDATFEAINRNENNPNLQYRIKRNRETTFSKWTTFVSGEEWKVSDLNGGDILELKGNNPNGFSKYDENARQHLYTRLTVDKAYDVSGNVMALVDNGSLTKVIPYGGTFLYLFGGINGVALNYSLKKVSPGFLTPKTLTKWCYEGMFKDCANLYELPNLPATTLAEGCYSAMFGEDLNITKTPDFPATELEPNCYQSMFLGCTKLVNVATLPATTLANDCYSSMFAYCSSLTEAPSLPATKLADYCYMSMFEFCTDLTDFPELPATTMKPHCYSCMFRYCNGTSVAPNLPAMILAEGCYEGMFSGWTLLEYAPSLPATELKLECYSGMFSGCTKLIETPILPATVMAEGCYGNMFSGCSNLKQATDLLATTLAKRCYLNMFLGCSQLHSLNMYATTLGEDSIKEMLEGAGSDTSGGASAGGLAHCVSGMESQIQHYLPSNPSWTAVGDLTDGGQSLTNGAPLGNNARGNDVAGLPAEQLTAPSSKKESNQITLKCS